ncbi:small integral membrane protein 26-like [Erpetoichthys calabaricus]|uniref:small integral membrane protein 26-like n=1 Tax=Erpetoichthys calabaricus TaxID=27687 RepID=UPI00109F9469|nr:small integral membrane protein 26-like [Erpetoichthys calabaricus]
MKSAFKWNVRASLVYAIGIWTMFGSMVYFNYGKKWNTDEGKKSPFDMEAEESDNLKVMKISPNFVVTATYKENYVPLTSRIAKYLKSFGNSAEDDVSEK